MYLIYCNNNNNIQLYKKIWVFKKYKVIKELWVVKISINKILILKNKFLINSKILIHKKIFLINNNIAKSF